MLWHRHKEEVMMKKKDIFLKKYLIQVLLFGVIITLVFAFCYGSYKQTKEFPIKIWKVLLLTMQEEDFEQLRELSTERGFNSIIVSDNMEISKVFLRESSKKWSELEVEWTRVDDNTVEAEIGSPFRTTKFIFVRDGYTWKLDEWRPTW